ncbi:MAG: type II and III secretion system protein [Pirellula sp.]
MEAVRAAAARPEIIQPAIVSPLSPTENSNRGISGNGLFRKSGRERASLGSQCDEFLSDPTQLGGFNVGPTVNDPVFQAKVADVVPAGITVPPVSSTFPVSTVVYRLSDNNGINEVFEQTDIREAIQVLATYAKVSVVIDDTVGGVTSAQISGESFEQALEKVLLPLGLVFGRDGDRYVVASPDPDSPLFAYVSQRTQFAPNFHEVASLAALLPPRFKKFIQVSTDRNLVIIDAPKTIFKQILDRLQELDQPIPQVELEAIVCVVAPDSAFRFGLDWSHVVGAEGAQSFKLGMSGLTLNSAASGKGIQDAFSDFAVTSAFVRLLAQEGYITIRAAPRVTAKDGEKAKISINRETFFSLQPANSNVFFRQDVQKVEAGISLEITPRVHGDMVSVEISKAEVSEDIRSNTTGSDVTASTYPIINRRVVSTDVMVRDGHTIVIGGLVQRQTVDRIARIPVLGSIPLAGKLFQTIEKQEQEAEVAIFISPRIVPSDPTCPTPPKS